MTNMIIIITTVQSEAEAEKLASLLVEKKLAACVQISGPVKSFYRWNDSLKKSTEWKCSVKTVQGNYHKIEQFIKDHHPYDLPEIISVPVFSGSWDYLSWVEKESK